MRLKIKNAHADQCTSAYFLSQHQVSPMPILQWQYNEIGCKTKVFLYENHTF
jgi:hypothetical protein